MFCLAMKVIFNDLSLKNGLFFVIGEANRDAQNKTHNRISCLHIEGGVCGKNTCMDFLRRKQTEKAWQMLKVIATVFLDALGI